MYTTKDNEYRQSLVTVAFHDHLDMYLLKLNLLVESWNNSSCKYKMIDHTLGKKKKKLTNWVSMSNIEWSKVLLVILQYPCEYGTPNR